jgi:glycosyltransferase involved in cell wall biosynthesis
VTAPSPLDADASLPRLSVVAPTYKRRAALPGFVEPLLCEPGLYELVIAVDGSGDGSVEWLRERAADDPRLKVLDLPNRGAGATRQAGVEAATGDIVLLMDDDVIAEPGLVMGHLRHHRDRDRKLVLGYMPNDWASLPPGRRGIALIYRRAYEGHVARFAKDRDFVLHGLWGGNFSMPRSGFLEVGIEKLAVKRGQDDREFGIRCLKAGFRGEFDPALRARHLYDRPFAAFRRDCRIQGESRKLIHDIHDDLLGSSLVRSAEGSEVEDEVGLGLPRPVRRIWPYLARDPLFGLTTGALTLAFRLGVRLRNLWLETQSARAIGSLETMRGVLDRS